MTDATGTSETPAASVDGTDPPSVPSPVVSKDDSGFFQPYSEYAKSLRTWFVAYGIGAPVLLVTNKDLWQAVSARTGHVRLMAFCFLTGVVIQVVEALLYKHAMWHLYEQEFNPAHSGSKWFKAASWISTSYKLEVLFDVATLLLFTVATVLLFLTLV